MSHDMHVGGVLKRWEHIVAGESLAQIAHAEPLAKPGETVVSPQAWWVLEQLAAGDGHPGLCDAAMARAVNLMSESETSWVCMGESNWSALRTCSRFPKSGRVAQSPSFIGQSRSEARPATGERASARS